VKAQELEDICTAAGLGEDEIMPRGRHGFMPNAKGIATLRASNLPEATQNKAIAEAFRLYGRQMARR